MSDLEPSDLSHPQSSEALRNGSPVIFSMMESILASPVKTIIGLAVLSVLVYLNSIGNGFAYDDVLIIEKNPLIRSVSNIPRLFIIGYWDTWYAGAAAYRPFLMMTFALNYFVSGAEAWSYHLVNVLLHAANGCLLYFLLIRYQVSLSLAAVAGIIFAIHPVHTEAVSNVIGRGEVLAAFWCGMSWLCWKEYQEAARPFRKYGLLLAASGAYLIGLLTKESIIVLPVLLFGLDLFRADRVTELRQFGVRFLKQAVPYLGFVGGLAIYFGLRSMAGQILSQSSEISLPEMAKLSSWGRLCTMASMSLEYFRLLVIGYPLRPYYDPLAFGVLSSPNWRSWLGLFGVIGLALGAIVAYRRAPIVTFAIGFVFVTLGLFSNIVFLVGSLVAERFLYLPSVGYAILIAWFAERYVFSAFRTGKPALGQFLPAVVLLVCCVGYIGITTRRNLDWANNEALFTRFIETDPKSSLGYTIVGDIFLQRGELPEARRLFDTCLTLSPSSFAGHWGLCQIDFQEGKVLDCRKRIDFLLGFEPPQLLPPADDWAQVHMLNARLSVQEQNWEKAIIEADRAVTLSPVVPDAQLLAADIRVQANQMDTALRLYQALIRQYPDFDRGFNNYGVVLLRLGKLTEAEIQFQQALRLNPDSTVAARNLGLVQSRLQSVPK